MKRSRLSKCAVFLLILCLLSLPVFTVSAKADDAPPSDEVITDTPSEGIDSPDTPSGGIDSPDTPSGGEDPQPSQASTVVTNAANDVFPGTWQVDANGVWHYASSNAFRNTWGYIVNPYAKENDAIRYRLDSDGKMLNYRETDASGNWYWFDSNGNVLTGWQYINGKWYYLNPSNDGAPGALQLGGVTPDGWTVDANGVWIESIPQK